MINTIVQQKVTFKEFVDQALKAYVAEISHETSTPPFTPYSNIVYVLVDEAEVEEDSIVKLYKIDDFEIDLTVSGYGSIITEINFCNETFYLSVEGEKQILNVTFLKTT